MVRYSGGSFGGIKKNTPHALPEGRPAVTVAEFPLESTSPRADEHAEQGSPGPPARLAPSRPSPRRGVSASAPDSSAPPPPIRIPI